MSKPNFGKNSDDIMNLNKISTTNLTNYQQQVDYIIEQNRDIFPSAILILDTTIK